MAPHLKVVIAGAQQEHCLLLVILQVSSLQLLRFNHLAPIIPMSCSINYILAIPGEPGIVLKQDSYSFVPSQNTIDLIAAEIQDFLPGAMSELLNNK